MEETSVVELDPDVIGLVGSWLKIISLVETFDFKVDIERWFSEISSGTSKGQEFDIRASSYRGNSTFSDSAGGNGGVGSRLTLNCETPKVDSDDNRGSASTLCRGKGGSGRGRTAALRLLALWLWLRIRPLERLGPGRS